VSVLLLEMLWAKEQASDQTTLLNHDMAYAYWKSTVEGGFPVLAADLGIRV
jgi:hypothetical protein